MKVSALYILSHIIYVVIYISIYNILNKDNNKKRITIL